MRKKALVELKNASSSRVKEVMKDIALNCYKGKWCE
jgi:lipocalin